jgi:hypothetical protein
VPPDPAYGHVVISHRPPAVVVVLLALVLSGLLSAVGVTSSASGAAGPGSGAGVPTAIGVTPDPAGALYRGTGALLVSQRDWRSGSGRAEAAGCVDCEWQVSVLCTKAELAAGNCRRLTLGCPVGFVPVRIWLRHVGGDWTDVGRACQGPTPPRTVADVAGAVRDEALARLPALHAAAQPEGGTLVGVPVAFRTGQPPDGLRGADLSVLGLDVRLDARARWLWDFGDGTAASWASSPGGRYPDLSVSHTYRRAARPTAKVTAVWRGQFTVEGLGPFAVSGDPLTQTGSVPVVVRAARAVLVG